ncbi:DUF1345 domain-containing protein [Novosphingobium bradum]|uniref:DUF1345 domain-containing protein n=1 Tax=Novosphingobium bradum TaxID=1737444 RepID=A0ABV7IM25_9SPHN
MKHTRHPLRLFLGQRIAPPRFLVFLLLLPSAAWAIHGWLARDWPTALALGFDVAAGVFLASLLPLVLRHEAEAIRCRADANDANRVVVLVVSSVLTVVVMAAIAGELAGARSGDMAAIAGLIATLVLIWLFANAVYTLHYAHEYYSPDRTAADRRDRGGLEFPGTPEPGYRDFAYFAFTLGMTFQTSDVAITATRIRAVAILHSFAAFVFNIGVIAFTINVLGGAG